MTPLQVGAVCGLRPLAVTLLGFGDGFALLLALAFVTGAATMGAQNISYSFVSQYYPSSIRSTAIGLASGVGRLGAIFGPTFGGLMLGTDLPIEASFVAFAVPGSSLRQRSCSCR